MIKVSLFPSVGPGGQTVFPLQHRVWDGVFEKTAAPTLLPGVSRFISGLRAQNGTQDVLVNALGAQEYFGSNSNGDGFCEEGLRHAPEGWTENPEIDRELSRRWPYGYPTFYNAHVFVHHRNKDPRKSVGRVLYAAWHPHMKRVELILRFHKELCEKFGGMLFWDRMARGELFDVSMGSKVKFDLCSICTDWVLYRKALATFDPKIHASPDVAILAYHKHLVAERGRGIRGLAVTRRDYCEHALCQMNRILPDGRKVFVHNPYANFFDISGVFIGADKTAKGLYKIAAPPIYSIPSALVAEQLGYRDDEVKTAAKVAEMDKNVTPTQFGGEAVPLVTSREPHLPQHILRLLAERPLDKVLGAATRLGIVFRPREFQRLMLERSGDKPLADALDQARVVFGREPQEKVSLGESDSLSEALLTPFCLSRSSFGPVLHKRLTLISVDVHAIPRPPSSLDSEPLRKIGSVYSGYRDSVMDALLKQNQQESKTGSGATITPLTRAYLETAYWDEVGVDTGHGSQTGVEKGAALQRTRVPIA